jgi:phospholipase C
LSFVKRLAAIWVGLAFIVGASAMIPVFAQSPERAATATPIKHVVILYGENVSFDHYFGTYPQAANPPDEPYFRAAAGTPAVNNLITAHLLHRNPNFTNALNGPNAAEPFRLDPTEANTADQNHKYTAEQQAYDGGRADLFPKYTGKGTTGGAGAFGTLGQVMGYFDGNTVTALWRYAQQFAMNDNAFSDTYGPSSPGALEAVSGQTNGMEPITVSQSPSSMASPGYYIKDGQDGFTMINDVDPESDSCSSKTDAVFMAGRNIGDLLNDAGITWGGFMGGFDMNVKNANGTTGCLRSTLSPIVAATSLDYIPHHNWFAYYPSTANSTHETPSAVSAIGHSRGPGGKPDPANHEYDLNDFYTAVKAGNFPAVSYLKAPAFQDGHAGYSDPVDEQHAIVRLVNFLESRPEWKETAIILAWDDSDGWYDHASADVTSPSFDAVDQRDGNGICGTGAALPGVNGKPVNGRCGPGTRIPFLVISPWARSNMVSHTRITQASIVRFIEDNWLHGQRLGGGSFDASAGSIMDMFDFRSGGHTPALVLDLRNGNVVRSR